MKEDPIIPWNEYAEDPEFLNLPIGERLGLFDQWAEATISRVQPFVKSEEDKQYVNNYLNTVRDSVLDSQTTEEVLGNAFKRSFLRAKQGIGSGMSSGALSPKNESALLLSEINQELESLPTSSLARKIGSDETSLVSTEGWKEVLQDPARGAVAFGEFLLENIPAQVLTTIGAGVAGTLACVVSALFLVVLLHTRNL